jgi:hypothetical protein
MDENYRFGKKTVAAGQPGSRCTNVLYKGYQTFIAGGIRNV